MNVTSGTERVRQVAVIFFRTVKSKAQGLVKNCPTIFTTELVESFESNPSPLLDHLALHISCLFSHVENIAGNKPEQAPLVPGFGIS